MSAKVKAKDRDELRDLILDALSAARSEEDEWRNGHGFSESSSVAAQQALWDKFYTILDPED